MPYQLLYQDICRVLYGAVNDESMIQSRLFYQRYHAYFLLSPESYEGLASVSDRHYFLFLFFDSIIDQLPDRVTDDSLMLDWYRDYNFSQFQSCNYQPIRHMLQTCHATL